MRRQEYNCSVQQLQSAINSPLADVCAAEVLAVAPLLMRFLRSHMRQGRGAGLSVPQFRTLIFVNRRPGTALAPVAEHIGISLAAASRLVTHLVRRRLLTRHAHPDDRRQVALSLTARGQALFDSAWEGARAAVARQLAPLPGDELQDIAAALRTLRPRFTEAAQPEPPRAARRLRRTSTRGES